jgi:hypothetical protein
MNRLDKMKLLSVKAADVSADLALINEYSNRELKVEEIYCFDVILCDNEVDRDIERFPKASLDKLASLFVGKTGIFDHRWTAANQIARLYRAEVQDTGEKNSLGESLLVLRGSAYMLRNETTQPFIHAIEGGILKEVSVGFQAEKVACSICGETMSWNWAMGTDMCENKHVKGTKYEEGLCYGEILDPSDAYEFSFVAVPAQPGAGVTKSDADIKNAFDTLLGADLGAYAAKIKELIPRLNFALATEDERLKRAQILENNKRYLTAQPPSTTGG